MADIDIDPSLLKGDFDPEKHEELVEKLAANFGDDELDENGEIMKVIFINSCELSDLLVGRLILAKNGWAYATA